MQLDAVGVGAIVQVALESDSTPDETLRARISTLPVLPRAEMTRVYSGFAEPAARPLRTDRTRSTRSRATTDY